MDAIHNRRRIYMLSFHRLSGVGLLALAIGFLSSGCTVKLVSSYDEATDKAVTLLQKKTEAHLVKLESVAGLPECVYDQHRAFYNDAKVEISGVAVRAEAIPKNQTTTEATKLLAQNIDSLEKLHKIACISSEQIVPLRSNFNSNFTAILKLELAKRRGEE